MDEPADPLALDPLDPPAEVPELPPLVDDLEDDEAPVDEAPPDPLIMNISHLVAQLAEAFEEGDDEASNRLGFGALPRVVAYARDLEDEIAEPVDEAPIRKAERERLAVFFETTDLRAFTGQDGVSAEFVAFLLRLDHSA